MRESGGQLRDVDMPGNGWGWIDLKKLAIADGGADLLHGATLMAPDDGNADDRTVIANGVAPPVRPGRRSALDRGLHRTDAARVRAAPATSGTITSSASGSRSWASTRRRGTRGRTAGGWNCHQFHANSEFYADYGSFDVRITAPSASSSARRDS